MMKLTTSTKQMLAAVSVASKVISSKNAMPILDCVKLWYKEGQWWLTGGDTEKQVTISAPVTETEGEVEDICLVAAKLVQTLSALPDAPMTIETKDKTVTIKVGKGKYHLPYETATEYPMMQSVGGESQTTVTMAASVFVQNVKAGLAARAEDELRPQLSGVAMVFEGEKCTFCASDGHRMYTYDTACRKSGEDRTIIIPSAVAKNVDAMFRASGEVNITTDGKKLFLYSDGISMVSTMIEGRYPNFKSVIPDVNQCNTIVMDCKEFISALQRCSVFASDATQLVCMESVDGSTVTLASEDIDFARGGVEEIGVEQNTCAPGFRIGANIGHLVGLLKNITTKNVIVKVSDDNRPIVFLEDNPDSGMLELQMPMLLN